MGKFLSMLQILKAPAYALFLVFLAISLLTAIPNVYINWGSFFLLLVMYSFWLGMLEDGLHKRIPPKAYILSTLFQINAVYVVAAPVAFFIYIWPDSSGELSGLSALPGFYYFFAQVHLHYHISKVLVSAEQKRRVNFKEHLGEFFMFLFWPIGIWALQPRIRAVLEQPAYGISTSDSK